jgi:hypothetical protein
MKIEIEKNIPAPPHKHSGGLTETMKKMEIGDSILLPDTSTNRHYPYEVAVRLNIKIRYKIIDDGKMRVWRIE